LNALSSERGRGAATPKHVTPKHIVALTPYPYRAL
jgi:hypothetical protein